MFRGLGKRGQEGLTLTTLLLIVLGVVVVVVIILGVTGAFDFIFSKTGQIPGQDLQTIATGCELAAENGLIADYCYTFKEVADDQWINCQDGRIQAILTQKGGSVLTCQSSDLVKAEAIKICKGVSSGKFDETQVWNGETNVLCNSMTCEDYSGQIVPSEASCPDATQVKLSLTNNVACCVSA